MARTLFECGLTDAILYWTDVSISQMGLRINGSGFSAQGLGLGFKGLEFKVSGLRFGIRSSELRDSGLNRDKSRQIWKHDCATQNLPQHMRIISKMALHNFEEIWKHDCATQNLPQHMRIISKMALHNPQEGPLKS